MIKSRYLAAFAAAQMFYLCYIFYQQGDLAYIPPMVSMTLFCLFFLYIDWKRDREYDKILTKIKCSNQHDILLEGEKKGKEEW